MFLSVGKSEILKEVRNYNNKKRGGKEKLKQILAGFFSSSIVDKLIVFFI